MGSGRVIQPQVRTWCGDVNAQGSNHAGLLAALVAKPVGYMAGIDQGKTNPTSQADILRGLVTGVASPESNH